MKPPRLDADTFALVGALCRGYDAREAVIRRGCEQNADRALLAQCLWLNDLVDRGLAVCPDGGMRAQIKRALCGGQGFDTVGVPLCGKNQFYREKNAVRREIARLLHLI